MRCARISSVVAIGFARLTRGKASRGLAARWRGGRSARCLASLLAVALIAAPAFAVNKPHRAECKRMTRQIARYERDAKWARERGNELWEDASRERVKELAGRRAELCPQYRRKNPFVAFGDMVANAAKLAAPYVIPGL